jgi:hypothetical protein
MRDLYTAVRVLLEEEEWRSLRSMDRKGFNSHNSRIEAQVNVFFVIIQ